MQTYNVFYLVSGEGEEDGSIQPELKTITIEGDINIEYVLI